MPDSSAVWLAAGVAHAVEPGDQVYQFVAADAGTYWYHSHQVSHEQVRLGLFGPLVVRPRAGTPADLDQLALVHTYAGRRTIAGRAGETRLAAMPHSTVRVLWYRRTDPTIRP